MSPNGLPAGRGGCMLKYIADSAWIACTTSQPEDASNGPDRAYLTHFRMRDGPARVARLVGAVEAHPRVAQARTARALQREDGELEEVEQRIGRVVHLVAGVADGQYAVAADGCRQGLQEGGEERTCREDVLRLEVPAVWLACSCMSRVWSVREHSVRGEESWAGLWCAGRPLGEHLAK